jgi:PTH1 family peptidyl-tRNA hydrolase
VGKCNLVRLIVGLGNPGCQYASTRHNIGFMAIDSVFEMFPGTTIQSDNRAHFYQTEIHNQRILLLKPQLYMNRSGIAVREILQRYEESPEHIIVIYDDLDLAVGRLRIRKKGGHGGHKGLKSIIECLETKKILRIRMGIGRPERPVIVDKEAWQNQIVNYVLQPFGQDEQPLINVALKRCVEAIELIVVNQTETAMNTYHRS